MLSLLQLLEGMADGYLQEKARFKEQLRGDGQGKVPCGHPGASGGAGGSGSREGDAFDYMQVHMKEAVSSQWQPLQRISCVCTQAALYQFPCVTKQSSLRAHCPGCSPLPELLWVACFLC